MGAAGPLDPTGPTGRTPLGRPSGTARRSKRLKKGVRGYDAAKKVNGRKRHILVDTMGLLRAVAVHPADIQDREGAPQVLLQVGECCPRLQHLWADAGYSGPAWATWVQETVGWTVEIVSRPPGTRSFAVLPRRWVVERTFGWLGRCRRLSKDYEELPATTAAWIRWAMMHLLLRRLA